jgi:hypothetical protein
LNLVKTPIKIFTLKFHNLQYVCRIFNPALATASNCRTSSVLVAGWGTDPGTRLP